MSERVGTFVGHQGQWSKRRRFVRGAAVPEGCASGREHAIRRLPLLFAAFALCAAILLYYPALQGGFVLDDLSLPLTAPPGPNPLAHLGSGTRPVLVLSYGLNALLLGDSPASFHFVNLIIHVLNSCLVLLVLRRLLQQAGWGGRERRVAGWAGALLFLVHPLQTESVSYVAGRSESLASFFVLLAYSVYLYNRSESIRWRRAFAVIFIFGVAVLTKENAVSLAGILLLTDLMGPKANSLDGPRRNFRLYALMLPGAILAAAAVFRMLAGAHTAGFAVAKYTWYQYLFTEARAIFTYIRLAIAPLGQSLDHDFAASYRISDHGAALFLGALVLLVGAAIRWRARYPLSAFGFLMFLTFLAPTSSVVPIDDPLVERRMYLALLGLILIGCDVARRVRLEPRVKIAAAAVLLVAFGGLCHARNRLWGNPELLIAQSAEGAQHNPRPLLNISEILIRHDRCDLALPYLDRADRILPNSYFVHSIRGRALACLGRSEEGIRHMEIAAGIRPCGQIYLWMGLLYGKMGRLPESGASLQKAIELDPTSAPAHSALATWHEARRDFAAAEREYAAALQFSPGDEPVRVALERVRRAIQDGT